MELESLLKPLSLKLKVVSQKLSCGNPDEVLLQLQQAVKLSCTSVELRASADVVHCLVEIISTLRIRELGDQTKLFCLDLLNNLVAMDTSLAGQLQDTIPTLSEAIQQHMDKSDHPLVLPCLRLLHKVAYRGRPLTLLVPVVEKLLCFLSHNIRSLPPDSPLIPYLVGTLSSLARHSVVVQLYVKEQPKVNSLYRSLVSFLSHSNLSVIVYSLSALLSLCFNESLGDKLFSMQNVHQTFQMMFGMLTKSPGYLVTEHAIDLFLDLLHHDKIRQSLCSYPHLEQSLCTLICLISPSLDDLSASKLLELLDCLMFIQSIRSPLAQLAFSRRCQPAFQAVLQWGGIGHSEISKLQLNSMKFLKNLAEEATTSGLAIYHKSEMTSLLTASVAMVTVVSDNGGLTSDYEACVMAESLAIVLICSQCESQKNHVVQSITSALCYSLYTMSLGHSSLVRSPHDPLSVYDDVTVKCLHLMVHLTDCVPGMADQLNTALLEPRLLSVLAQSLTSSDRDRIMAVLQLLPTVLQTPHFQLLPFALTIAEMNADVERLTNPPSPVHEHRHELKRECFPMNQSSQPELQQLIDRMKNGLEIKDAKASDIIDIYEHKLASLQMREGQLQDLLEAKTLALSQADRIISQNRARQAGSEADGRKLISLLQKSEQEQEAVKQRLHESERGRSEAESEIEGLLSKVESLEEVVKQHQQLIVIHSELQQKMESLQETLAAQREENQSLSDMLETMRRHDESLKKQLDCTISQMQQVELQRQQLEEQVGEKEASIVSLKQALKEQEAINRQHEKDKKKLEDQLGGLRGEITQMEAVRAKQEERIRSLEETCRKQEAVISQQRTELDKHSQIVAMIHNMTGKS